MTATKENAISTEDMETIDAMTYEQMLRKWRFGTADRLMFQGATGEYFRDTMNEKGEAISMEDRVAISKRIGLGKI